MPSAILSKKAQSPLGQLLKNDSSLIAMLKSGDLVESEFIELGAKKAFFDLKKYNTGIVFGLEYTNAQDVIKNLKPGDKTLAKVIDPENEQGYVELSLAEADKQKSWQTIKELADAGEIVKVKINGANSGGLLAEINELKAFLPVSQLTQEHYPKIDDGDRGKILEELKKLVGQELDVKIIDFNPRSSKLIISERELASGNAKESLAKYKVSDIIDGIVSGITDFGVFIKFANDPDLEGLIHISELDHRLIENPKELVNRGEYSKVIEDQVVVGLNQGDLAPNFSGKTPEGKSVQSSDYLGKAVLVEFWATWCVNCAEEFPGLNRVAKEFSEDFVVLAIDYREKPDTIRRFFTERPYTFVPVIDEKGEIAQAFGVVGTPHAFFIDKEGKIAKVQLGAKDESEIRHIVAGLLGK